MPKKAAESVAPLAGAWIEIEIELEKKYKHRVAPLAGAWIEIRLSFARLTPINVAPLAGAWIEMNLDVRTCLLENQSLPSRERGLKFADCMLKYGKELVAPLAGAWIEIFYYQYWREVLFVAPLAGAWIEITPDRSNLPIITSLPSRERGLKLLLPTLLL